MSTWDVIIIKILNYSVRIFKEFLYRPYVKYLELLFPAYIYVYIQNRARKLAVQLTLSIVLYAFRYVSQKKKTLISP